MVVIENLLSLKKIIRISYSDPADSRVADSNTDDSFDILLKIDMVCVYALAIVAYERIID
jgi:hypothetical protein